VPHPFGKGRSSAPYFGEQVVFVGQFGPKTQLASHHRTTGQRIFERVVHVAPSGKRHTPRILAQNISVTAIQIKQVIIGKNNLLSWAAFRLFLCIFLF
jgi:hypothetical protein